MSDKCTFLFWEAHEWGKWSEVENGTARSAWDGSTRDAQVQVRYCADCHKREVRAAS